MYKKTAHEQEIVDFYLPFGGSLKADNRWIQMARLIPWDALEEKYAKNFKSLGRRAKKVRIAVGTLLIQQKYGYSDIETVTQIVENPYLQYFLGFNEYLITKPFDSSLMVYFRKRVTSEMLEEIDMALAEGKKKTKKQKNNDHDDDKTEPPENKGKLIVDATCAPSDIKYPTDLNLLNEGREKLEEMIDDLCGNGVKPRTYRRKARRDYLRAAKNKKLSENSRRKALRKQLNYVARDLKLLDKMDCGKLSEKQREKLEVIRNMYHQQKEMYDNERCSVQDRIVSLSQPHVRPIVRGKAGAGTEFGAKISISVVKGFCHVDTISWDNFNEGTHLEKQIELYRKRYGYYPAAVMADKIYGNRKNREYCRVRGIRLSGPPLGRPKQDETVRNKIKRQEKLDTAVRNEVEGSFGLTKRKFTLDLIMTKLKDTSETVIRLNFTLLNLERRLRLLLRQIFYAIYGRFYSLLSA